VTAEEMAPIAADGLVHQQAVTAPAVIRSFAFSTSRSCPHVLLALSDNRLVLQELTQSDSKELARVDHPGHSSDVRALALTSDANVLASTSQRTPILVLPRLERRLRQTQRALSHTA
jgi:hypothetical protein